MELVPISMELYPFLHLQIHKIMYPHILYLSHYVYPRISLPNLDPEKFLGFHMLISGGIPCSHDVYSRVSVFLSHYVSISDGIPWSCKVYPRICLVILDSKPFLAFPWSCNVYPRIHSAILDSFGKINILKPKYPCYMTNTISDVSRMSLIFTKFTYFPQDVSETHTSLHSTKLQLILHYAEPFLVSMDPSCFPGNLK